MMATTEDDATIAQEASDTAPTEEPIVGHQLDAQAESQIHKFTAGAMVIGIVPIPLVDLAALLALQMKMLHSLSKTYDIPFKANLGKSAIGSLISAYAPYASATPLAASISKLIPGIGHISAGATLVILNGASTYAIGKVFEQHFASGGTFLTFVPEKARDYFGEQYEKGKKVVGNLRGAKSSEVIDPIAEPVG
ncbi:MAG: DUF697 domain-containing protein [Mariprofundaceae bacterium]|nr:DUF697 domain-containing protein [Mariprofundaceae bacterium]